MDLGDWEGVGELFADAALADEHGPELARGADAVTAFYRAGTQLHDGSPRTKHLVLNTILDVDEEAGTATARSSYLVLQAPRAPSCGPIISGRYRDAFAAETARGASWSAASWSTWSAICPPTSVRPPAPGPTLANGWGRMVRTGHCRRATPSDDREPFDRGASAAKGGPVKKVTVHPLLLVGFALSRWAPSRETQPSTASS